MKGKLQEDYFFRIPKLGNYVVTVIVKLKLQTSILGFFMHGLKLKRSDKEGGKVPKRNNSENKFCHKPVLTSKIMSQSCTYFESLTHTGLQPKVLIPKF